MAKINKTRNARTSHEQLEILINFLEEHQIMNQMKTHPLKTNEVKVLWQELSKILNRKKGAIKSVEEWKRFLVTWKSKTKAKARMLRKEQTGTGGGPSAGIKLTEFEERLMVLIGWNTVEGCDVVAEELPPDVEESLLCEGIVNNPQPKPTEIIAVAATTEPIAVAATAEPIAVAATAEPIAVAATTEPIAVAATTETIAVAARETTSSVESVTTNSRVVPLKPTAPFQKNRFSRKRGTEALDNAAIVYKESSEQFLESARIIAASVEKLAIAFTTYAEATFAMAESKKLKYSNTCKNCRDGAN